VNGGDTVFIGLSVCHSMHPYVCVCVQRTGQSDNFGVISIKTVTAMHLKFDQNHLAAICTLTSS